MNSDLILVHSDEELHNVENTFILLLFFIKLLLLLLLLIICLLVRNRFWITSGSCDTNKVGLKDNQAVFL